MSRRLCIVLAIVCITAASGCGDSFSGPQDGSSGREAAVGVDATSRADGRGDTTRAGDGAARADGARDAGARADSQAPLPDASSSGTSKATVKLTYSGCSASFSGTNHVVVQNDTLTISSVAGAALTASMQLVLKQTSGTITLSSKQRQQTGTIVNLVTGGTTYSNITFDPLVYTGQNPDPIKGSITINKLSLASGVADLAFSGVTLENVSGGHAHCTLDGTVVTTGKSF